VSPSDQWRLAHDYRHHTFTNVLGKDRDLGFGILRMTPDQRWRPIHLAQPLYNAGLAVTFEWGIAVFDVEIDRSGIANIDGSPLFHILSGNLSHQIEHHLFPDLPSNRYAQIAPQVRALCERFGIPYTTGPLSRQTAEVWRRILRLALPGPSSSAEPACSDQLVERR
jgi:fatty acid desaturase